MPRRSSPHPNYNPTFPTLPILCSSFPSIARDTRTCLVSLLPFLWLVCPISMTLGWSCSLLYPQAWHRTWHTVSANKYLWNESTNPKEAGRASLSTLSDPRHAWIILGKCPGRPPQGTDEDEAKTGSPTHFTFSTGCFRTKNCKTKASIVVHTYNSRTQEAANENHEFKGSLGYRANSRPAWATF